MTAVTAAASFSLSSPDGCACAPSCARLPDPPDAAGSSVYAAVAPVPVLLLLLLVPAAPAVTAAADVTKAAPAFGMLATLNLLCLVCSRVLEKCVANQRAYGTCIVAATCKDSRGHLSNA